MTATSSSLVPSFVFDVLTNYADMTSPQVSIVKNMNITALDSTTGSIACFYTDASVATNVGQLSDAIADISTSVAFDGNIDALSTAFSVFLSTVHTVANTTKWNTNTNVASQINRIANDNADALSNNFLTTTPNANTWVAHERLNRMYKDATSNFQTKQMARLADVFLMFNVFIQIAGYGYAANMAGVGGTNVKPVFYAWMAWKLMKQCYEMDADIWKNGSKGFANAYTTLYDTIQGNAAVSNTLGTNASDVALTKTVLMSSLTAELEADAGLWSAKLWLWVWVAATALALGACVASAGDRRALAAVGGAIVGVVVLAFVLNHLSILTTSASAPTPTR